MPSTLLNLDRDNLQQLYRPTLANAEIDSGLKLGGEISARPEANRQRNINVGIRQIIYTQNIWNVIQPSRGPWNTLQDMMEYKRWQLPALSRRRRIAITTPDDRKPSTIFLETIENGAWFISPHSLPLRAHM
jgi:hypothetical protein